MAPKHIVDRINDAQLPATMYRTARLLLDLANATTGEVVVTHDQMRAIVDTDSDGTVRKHLIRLQANGIATYQRNAVVHVWFADWLPNNVHDTVHRSAPVRASDPVARDSRGSVPPARADAHSEVRGGDPPARDSRAGSTNSALSAHLPHTHADAHSGWLVGNTDPTDQGNQPTNPPDPNPDPELAKRLMRAVRMRPEKIDALAAVVPYGRIREAIAYWWLNRKAVGGKFDNHPGIVVNWLEKDTPVPPIDSEFMRTDLYRQHRTPAELAEEAAAEAAAAERLAMLEQPPAPEPRRELDPELSPYLDSDVAWLELVKADQAGELAGLVRIDHREGVPLYVLAARDPLRVQWLNSRMATRLRQNIAITVHHPVLVEIVPPVVAGG